MSESVVVGSESDQESLTCCFWGPLKLGVGALQHMNCDVVLRSMSGVVNGFTPKKIPMICECECQTCKRAWWDQGRPSLREDGTLRRSWDPR